MMEVAKLLVTFGAVVNTLNNRSETPLQIACYRNFDEVAKLLLELGSQRTLKTWHRTLPFTMPPVTSVVNFFRFYFSTVLIPIYKLIKRRRPLYLN